MSKKSRRRRGALKNGGPESVIFLNPNVRKGEVNSHQNREKDRQPYQYTINWNGEGNVLVPRELAAGELPEITSPTIRELIDNTARGATTPPGLRERLEKEPLDAIYEGIREGIRRWHTYGKEQG